jgi:hypothetical protein
VLEGVVTAIERSLNHVPGTKVVPNAKVPVRGSTRRRQVDVLVEIPTGPRALRVGVEVRCYKKPLDVTHIEQLGAKLAKLDLDRGCVVSASGFSEEAQEEAVRNNLETRSVEQVGLPDWWQATTVHFQYPKLLTCRLDYSPDIADSLSPIIEEVGINDLLVITPSDPPCSIHSLVDRSVTGKLQITERQEHDMVEARIHMDLPEGSCLRLPSGADVPLPLSIYVVFEICVESSPVTAFRVNQQVNAFTTVVLSNKQLTMVTERQPDGSLKVGASIGDAQPKVTHVPHTTKIP